MIRLLRTNLSRLRKDKWFLVCAAVMIVYGAGVCVMAYHSGKVNDSTIQFDSLFLNGCGPVSYTHLDVYKRQAIT